MCVEAYKHGSTQDISVQVARWRTSCPLSRCTPVAGFKSINVKKKTKKKPPNNLTRRAKCSPPVVPLHTKHGSRRFINDESGCTYSNNVAVLSELLKQWVPRAHRPEDAVHPQNRQDSTAPLGHFFFSARCWESERSAMSVSIAACAGPVVALWDVAAGAAPQAAGTHHPHGRSAVNALAWTHHNGRLLNQLFIWCCWCVLARRTVHDNKA